MGGRPEIARKVVAVVEGNCRLGSDAEGKSLTSQLSSGDVLRRYRRV
jgi:hypothetical protein